MFWSEKNPNRKYYISAFREIKMKCVLFLCAVFLGTSVAQKPSSCPEFCDLASCTEVLESSCIAEKTVVDSCGCCRECAKVLGETCGGEYWRAGKCALDYICVGNSPTVDKMVEVNIADDETGVCKCRDMDERVCGNDEVLYPSSCALKVASRRREMAGQTPIETAPNGGNCQYAPVINTPPKDFVKVYAGHQVYLSCEVEGNPIPDVVWYRDGKKMPDYHNNVVVQVRGGPGRYRETSWVMIDSKIEDSGVYQCHASNKLGETNRQATLVVNERPIVPEENDQKVTDEQPANQI